MEICKRKAVLLYTSGETCKLKRRFLYTSYLRIYINAEVVVWGHEGYRKSLSASFPPIFLV